MARTRSANYPMWFAFGRHASCHDPCRPGQGMSGSDRKPPPGFCAPPALSASRTPRAQGGDAAKWMACLNARVDKEASCLVS